MIAPLELEFIVECSPEHAFSTWTNASRWWPIDHSISAERDLEVVFEARVGGRVFERTTAGIEHDWGQVTRWEPPNRLDYLWHIGSNPNDATEVTVTFTRHDDRTLVRIEQRGWERFGTTGPDRRANNHKGWSGMLPHFVDACR